VRFNFSNDLVKGLTSPFDPLMNIENDQTYFKKGSIWREKEVKVEKSAQLRNVVLGAGSVIGDGASVVNSVIGRKSIIPAGVVIEDSILWNNVTLSQGCKIRNSIIAADNILVNGIHLGFGVILPPQTNLPTGTEIPDNQTFTVYSSNGQPLPNSEDPDDEEFEEIPIGISHSVYVQI
jgi:carbonic anhydrase/acetyltransferase-like protein (isoleucine patch superfamily)